MGNEKISDRQGILMIVMFIIGISIIIIPGLDAGKDAWIAVATSVTIALPIIITFARLRYIFSNLDLFDIIYKLFGSFFAPIIIFLYIIFILYASAIILRITVDYMHGVSLLQTPIIVTTAFITLLSILIVTQGIEVLGRYSEAFFLTTAITIVITFIILIPNIKMENIKPFFYEGIKPFMKGTYFLIIFPFTEIFIFTAVFKTFRNKASAYKIFIYGLLMGGAVGTVFTLYIILVLGINTATEMYYPSYFMARRIKLFGIFQGFEIIFAVSYIVTAFFKLSIYVLALAKGISRLFKFKEYRFMTLPTAMLSLNLSLVIYNNMVDVYSFYTDIWPYFATIFQIILPIIIYIFAEIRHKNILYSKEIVE